MAEHQHVDALSDPAAIVGQPLDQETVEGQGEQADVKGIDQVPEIGRLTQRGEEEQVVAEHREQHAVEGAAEPVQLLVLGRAGIVGAEVQRHVERAGGLDAQQQGGFAGRQVHRKPEIADLHRALGKRVEVSGQLLAQTAIGVSQEQLDMVEQRVVDLDEAAQRFGETVGQTGAQPPGRTVLAFVDMATLNGTKALGR